MATYALNTPLALAYRHLVAAEQAVQQIERAAAGDEDFEAKAGALTARLVRKIADAHDLLGELRELAARVGEPTTVE